MTAELRLIPLDQIAFLDRARDLDAAWVDALASMIRTQGLIQPIRVWPSGDGYRLIAGMHRFMAFRQLGIEGIPCTVSTAGSEDEARLEEVMENLGRQDLKALDRCRHLYEMKKVWERMYPETAHGGDRKSEEIKSQTLALDPSAPQIFGFAKATADKIGLGVASIKAAVTVWKRLSTASRITLADMPMAGKMTELKALSEQKPPRQAQILNLIRDPEHPDIQNVAEALFHLENGITPNTLERRFLSASKSFGSLDDVTFDHVLAAHEERVIASLKRRGRI